MSYQVIARKYRPQRFSDVIGQEHVTQTLANAIQKNRIAHAYLFVGPRGTGKTTLARIFAKCLNCTGGPKVDFSADDPRCQEIAEGRSLDVLEIDGASNRGIEEVRELRETVKYAPAASRFKIYIIDEVHMLTKEAFNALLKTLEEPPAHVKFMFATTEPEKVLPTILSRCQRFDLRRIPIPLIVQQLAHIARLENVAIDEPALHSIARGAEGGMRDAQSALDQLISFCGSQIAEEDVLSMFGLTSRSQVIALAQSLLEGNSAHALRELNELASKGKDLARLLSDLLNYFRNLLLFQISNGDRTLLDVSEAELNSLTEHARAIHVDGLTRIMDLLSEFEGRLRDAASKRILIEVALLKAIQARSGVSINTVLQKLQSLRTEGPGPAPTSTGTSSGNAPSARAESTTSGPPKTAKSEPAHPDAARATSMSAPAAATAPIAAPKPASAGGPPVPSSAANHDLVELWSKLVDAVGRASLFARTYLVEAHPISLGRGVLTVGFDPEFADHLVLVDNQKNRDLIQTKLRELGVGEVQVKFIKAEAPAGWIYPSKPSAPEPAPAAVSKPVATPSEPAPAKEAPVSATTDFKNDPLIKQALEVFKGQIVNVRA